MSDYADDLDAVIRLAHESHISTIITIGIDLQSSARAIELAQAHDRIYATVGIHPHEAKTATKETLDKLNVLAANPKVVGYGEIGLDYAKAYAPVDIQKTACRAQLQLAKALNLPVVIHDRDAHEDILTLLKEHAPFPAGGVMHCFSGDWQFAEEILKLGFYVSIPGIVTFKNATTLQQVARQVPLERLVIETDGPFLAPVPYRGKRNTPSLLLYTAEKIAELRDIPLTEVATATTVNAKNLFKLP